MKTIFLFLIIFLSGCNTDLPTTTFDNATSHKFLSNQENTGDYYVKYTNSQGLYCVALLRIESNNNKPVFDLWEKHGKNKSYFYLTPDGCKKTPH